jgi:regulator of RNase E activity RraA
MTELSAATRDALLGVGTSTLTGILNRHGFRNMFMQEVWPIRPHLPRLVGLAYTMRFIPAREDKAGRPAAGPLQQQAMEGCPPDHVLVVDARGDARAASAGDIYCGRLKARGCAGIVTDGGLRDTDGIARTGLVAYHRRPSSPPSGIVHQPIDIGLPIACGGVAVYPGDVVVGDGDGIVCDPARDRRRGRRRGAGDYPLRRVRSGRGGARPLARRPLPGCRRGSQARFRGLEADALELRLARLRG